MKIYLMIRTATMYGGAPLRGNLRFLDQALQKEINSAKCDASFNEIWLTLSTLPSTAPSTKMHRVQKKVEVALQAPEFSTYFDTSDGSGDEVTLACALIDRYLEAGELIHSKLKKEDTFDIVPYTKALLDIREKITPEFLASLNEAETERYNDETVNRSLELRKRRLNEVKPKNKLIREIRVYTAGLSDKSLHPYSTQYCEIFRSLLRSEGFTCPTYDHLYISVAPTRDEALRHALPFEPWHTYGISVIDYKSYQTKTENEKAAMVFDVIVNGLLDIANLDQLNASVITEVANKIREKRLETELLFKKVENIKYSLSVTYSVTDPDENYPVYFELTDKETGRSKKVLVGNAGVGAMGLWLQKIVILKDKIKVRPGMSTAADSVLDRTSLPVEFDISEVFSV